MGIPHLGFPEIALIVVLVLIIFGVGKLPQVGSALGKGIWEFRRAKLGEDDTKKIVESKNKDRENENLTEMKASK
jgi:sec-independent protein translocase protein TatA